MHHTYVCERASCPRELHCWFLLHRGKIGRALVLLLAVGPILRTIDMHAFRRSAASAQKQFFAFERTSLVGTKAGTSSNWQLAGDQLGTSWEQQVAGNKLGTI